jgi:transposase
VARTYRTAEGHTLSHETVCQTLKDAGLKAKKKVTKPKLPKHICDARLSFAHAHRHWTVEDWKGVMWSDDTKINCLGSDGQQWVWIRPGQELSDAAIQPTAHSGGGSIQIWGCFCWDGPGYATKIEDTVTKEVYVEILEDELMQTLEYYGKEVEDIIFQQDNAPAHKSKLATNWLADNGFEVMEWPSNSPDLNPIENLWGIIKRRLGEHEHPPRGVLELWERFQVEWEKVEPELCQNLISSMPNRMREVIKAKGGSINY